jgi:hypothetical protein
MTSIARALQKVGQIDAVAKMDPAVGQMLRSPHTQAWWPASMAFALTSAIAAVGGSALVQRVGQLAVIESISVIVRPVVNLLMAISGPSPATLFSRFGQISQAAVKNVKFEWKPIDPTSGELTITYPLTVPDEYVAYWLGAFDFVWATTKKPGKSIPTHRGASLHFALSWGPGTPR